MREGNSTFQNKIARIDGGLRVLQDVGFESTTMEDGQAQWILTLPDTDSDRENQKLVIQRTLDQLDVALTQLNLEDSPK